MTIERSHNVVRNVGASKIKDDGSVDGSAFRVRSVDTDGLTVNWLDYFEVEGINERLEQIRKAFSDKGRKIGKSSKFAELSVGKTVDYVKSHQQKDVSFVHCPEEHDESHSGIMGYRPEEDIIADMIAETVIALHSGVSDS